MVYTTFHCDKMFYTKKIKFHLTLNFPLCTDDKSAATENAEEESDEIEGISDDSDCEEENDEAYTDDDDL